MLRYVIVVCAMMPMANSSAIQSPSCRRVNSYHILHKQLVFPPPPTAPIYITYYHKSSDRT
eukprot:263918-Amphidinium_carterae.3